MYKEGIPASIDAPILPLLAHAVFPDDNPLPQQIDWAEAYPALQAQAVELLPGNLLRIAKLPADLSAAWRQQVIAGCMHFSRIAAAQNKLCGLLRDANVSFVILKGMAAAQYYPTPEYRTMGDVDFLVAGEDYDRTVRLLLGNGFAAGLDDGRHLELGFGGVSLEMHHYFGLEPGDADPVNRLLTEALPRSQWIRVGEAEFPCLPPFENGLVLLQHIYQHFRREGKLGLRQIIDWELFVAHEIDDSGWPIFRELIECVGLTKMAMLVTRMGQLYLGLPETIKWCRDADPNDCATMMRIILESGNFGRLRPSAEQSVSAVSRQLRQDGFISTMSQRGQEIRAENGKGPIPDSLAWSYGLLHYTRRALSIGKVRDAVAGYQKGKHLDTLLKHLGLKE